MGTRSVRERVRELRVRVAGTVFLLACLTACTGGGGSALYGESADEAYSAGKRFLAEENPAEAVKAFRVSVERNPYLVLAHYDLALALRSLGENVEAMAAAQKVVELDKRLSGAHVLLAELSLGLGEPAIALKAAGAALGLDEELHAARLLKGQAQEAMGEVEAALVTYTELLERSPSDRIGRLRVAAIQLKLGREGKALNQLKTFVQQHPDVLEGHLLLGGAMLDRENPDAAADAFLKATRIDERSAEARWGLGRAYLSRGQDQLAVIELQKAVKLNPKLADAYVALGEAEMRRGFSDKALGYVDEALSHNPTEISAFMLKARIQKGDNDIEGMEASYRAAVKAAPGSLRAVEALSRHLMATKRPKEAAELLDALAESSRPTIALLVLGAQAHEASAQGDRAVALLRRALDEGGDNKVLGYLVKIALDAPGKGGLKPEELVELADRHFQASRSGNVEAVLMLARAYVAMGVPSRAREVLEGADDRMNDPRIDNMLRSLP